MLVAVRTRGVRLRAPAPPSRSSAAIPSSETRRAVATESESAPSETSAGTTRVPVPGSRGANGPTPSPPSKTRLQAQVAGVEGERGREGGVDRLAADVAGDIDSRQDGDRVGGLGGAGEIAHLVGDPLQPLEVEHARDGRVAVA